MAKTHKTNYMQAGLQLQKTKAKLKIFFPNSISRFTGHSEFQIHRTRKRKEKTRLLREPPWRQRKGEAERVKGEDV
ncbi:hypothetical protein SESBI_51086 [Sesbania bispinosa]|nr:hypothetical protein SESBI_51086 [Sesbania bispinosa]